MTGRPWISTTAIAAPAVAVWLLLVMLPEARRDPLWALGAVVGASFLGTGIVAWRLHPRNRVGPLMAAVGIAWIPQQLLIGDGAPAPFVVWLGACGLWAGLACHLFLAYPTGRLDGLPSRVVVGVAYAESVVLPGASVAVRTDPPEPLGSVALLVDGVRWQTVVVTGALVVGLSVARWREGSAAQRRAVTPVAAASLIATVAFVADHVAAGWGWGTQPLFVYAMFGAFIAVPLAYLGSLIRRGIDRGRVADLVVRLRGGKQPGDLEGELAAVLHDPTLRVGYWTAGQDRYVDAEGSPVELPPKEDGRVMTRVDRGGARLAVLLHDAALLEQPLLVEAACAAASLALENERLTADLKARLRQLAASRARMLRWGEAERRRIERDLHDGVQQRLLSVAMTLGLAEATAHSGRRDGLIGEAKASVLAALDDLRAVSHGIHPPVLTERGLPGAVKELAAVTPVPVECVIGMVEPLPAAVESAAYYIVNEALANVTKHARAGRAWVRLARSEGRLVVEIGDDGRGGADPARGSGLRGLSHRAEANGGSLRLDSRRGGGTVLRVTMPCE
ncbi:two-component sensor histidine kinase [Planomonospora parontospora subsp. parontospora]|uniref:histidine kinase n=2 Tax=Planomonospora parontospora TaxID=58119 RepID=A0AA37F6J6_9ACTN|nr:sensor histidine kinase [Planomonospora parontospora]GGK85618.1 two-component sensor histidine kinase [Planomonospora parontospora]GII10718.1 two-component sensor histidine kinase [Planomonospora parontospora subsp. parontospora]